MVHLIQMPWSQLQGPVHMHTITKELCNRRGRKFTLSMIQGNAKERGDVAEEQRQAASALQRYVRDEQDIIKISQ